MKLDATPIPWMADARCVGADDPELWFEGDVINGQPTPITEAAKAECQLCPVMEQCLKFAMQDRQLLGIWGGKTTIERRNAQRRSRRATQDTTPPVAQIGKKVSAHIARRRLQALATLGYSIGALRKLYVINQGTWACIRSGERVMIHAATDKRVREVWDELRDTTPTADTHQGRIGIEETIANAADKGYLPPSAWHDIETDEHPDGLDAPVDQVDDMKVQRVLTGRFEQCNRAERFEVIHRWIGSYAELIRITGWNVQRDLRSLKIERKAS